VSIGEVPLARLWQLADGTHCLLLKDPRAVNWEVRVVRSNEVLRSEHFGSPIIAMEEAKTWRGSFDRVVETSSHS
jgi:hypothetical protein